MKQVTLLDTGPLVAAINRRDQHHEWAYAQFERRQLPFLTCEAVLTEAVYLLTRSGLPAGSVFDLILSGGIKLAFDMGAEVETLKTSLSNYSYEDYPRRRHRDHRIRHRRRAFGRP